MPLSLFPPRSETIYGNAQLLRSRERTCVSLVEGCLAQIEAWEPRVHAWVSLDRERALQVARERDQELASGKARGPLHGIPIGIKDLYDIAGLPTGAGSNLLAKTIAAEDAFIITRLKQAGAILLGKTVTTQYACFDPPRTLNPWNLDRTPGGSSSGSAAAVATGMCLGAIGSQTGGSITRPASFCGVAGCKPTYGRVSVRGVFPLASSMDHVGPLARCVRDLALLLDAISVPDALDPCCSTAAPPSLAAELDRPAAAPRIGRLRGLFEDRAAPDCRTAVDQALSRIKAAGASAGEASLPDAFRDVIEKHRVVMTCEIAANHAARLERHPDDYLPCIQTLIEEGVRCPATDYIAARNGQARLVADFADLFEAFDVLACPASVGGAPDISSTGDPVMNAPWSYTGLPTVNVPIGLDEAGLPLGLQLVGRRFDEAGLFRAAAWCEAALQPG